MKQISIIVMAVIVAAVVGFGVFNMPPQARAQGSVTDEQTATSETTMTFAVKKMNCAACPITVRKAIEKVDGVKSVTVDFNAKSATVTFDPAVTTPAKIGQASTNAGYPATPGS